MYPSFILFSLLIASAMAFPSLNYPPYPYYQSPPPPGTSYGVPLPGNGYAQAPPPHKHKHRRPHPPKHKHHRHPPPPGNGYAQAPPPPKGNDYRNPPPPRPRPLANDKNVFLDQQNKVRKAVTVANLPMLVWNYTLEAYALNYANKRKRDCALEHSDGPYGENIAGGVGLSANETVSLWVDEKRYYDYASNGCTPGQVCGHYTQVVWNDTTQLGCARVNCTNGGTFVTCNYFPPGNYYGERPY